MLLNTFMLQHTSTRLNMNMIKLLFFSKTDVMLVMCHVNSLTLNQQQHFFVLIRPTINQKKVAAATHFAFH